MQLERALFELRAGRAVRLTQGAQSLVIAAAETADMPNYAWISEKPVPGFNTRIPSGELELAALKLVRRAGLLPVLALVEKQQDMLELSIDALKQAAPEALQQIAEASLPVQQTDDCRVVAFRAEGETHVALVIGDPSQEEAPLMRIHSSCLTGDLLGSLRCDCGDQLHLALDRIAKDGAGILLYLSQEGRGIGLMNKLRAYGLQDQGLDTVAANEALGFGADERDFAIAGAMLKALGVSRVRLLSNNPRKAEELRREGIDVAEQIPLRGSENRHNAHYLETKRKRMGHS